MATKSHSPDTLGLELETLIRTRAEISKIIKGILPDGTIKQVTKDASVESPIAYLASDVTLFLGNDLSKRLAKPYLCDTAGYELVTVPLTFPEMCKVVKILCAYQVKTGEIFSNRTSFHVHTGYPSGAVFVRTALALGLKIEPLFYKIAGMGNVFRGLTNNAAYCRALASPPAVVLHDTGRMAILDPLGAIDADSAASMWGHLGRLDNDTERYSPLRYFGINVYSIPLRGTLEFRHFNYCNLSRHMEAAISLCQMTADVMQRIPISVATGLKQVSIFEPNDNGTYNSILDDLLSIADYYHSEYMMKRRHIETIRELIEITPQPVFSREIVASHIKTPRIGVGDANRFDLKLVGSAQEPGIVDIHVFNNSERHLVE